MFIPTVEMSSTTRSNSWAFKLKHFINEWRTPPSLPPLPLPYSSCTPWNALDVVAMRNTQKACRLVELHRGRGAGSPLETHNRNVTRQAKSNPTQCK